MCFPYFHPPGYHQWIPGWLILSEFQPDGNPDIRNFDGRPECGANDRKTPTYFAMVPFPCEWCTKINIDQRINQYVLSWRIPIYPSFQLWRWVKIASQKRYLKTPCEDDQRIRGLGVRFGQKHGCSFLFNWIILHPQSSACIPLTVWLGHGHTSPCNYISHVYCWNHHSCWFKLP